MLEEKLQPILNTIRNIKDDKEKYDAVQTYFREHEENLAEDLTDLTYICELPDSERRFLTYPVMGNWVLSQIDRYKPKTAHQQKVFGLIRKKVLETRFKNSHTEGYYGEEYYYDDPCSYTKIKDDITAAIIEKPKGTKKLNKLLLDLEEQVRDAVYNGKLPDKISYEIDIGHGLYGPISRLIPSAGICDGLIDPIDMSIMVVDDERPLEWYERFLAVGFQDREGQQGYFSNCEDALIALERGHYDVIISDIELGVGKMNGIEFAKRAYETQQRNNIEPRIAVFTYSREKFIEAQRELDSIVPDNFFIRKKGFFDATRFKFDVLWSTESGKQRIWDDKRKSRIGSLLRSLLKLGRS